MCLVYPRESKEAEVTAVKWAEERMIGGLVRMVAGGQVTKASALPCV